LVVSVSARRSACFRQTLHATRRFGTQACAFSVSAFESLIIFKYFWARDTDIEHIND
jgi:hypothetical protein